MQPAPVRPAPHRTEIVIGGPRRDCRPAGPGSIAPSCSTHCPTASTGSSSSIRGKGRLGEADVDEVLREIRLALLEADVNFKVVRDLVARIRERTVGAELVRGADPGAAGHQDRQRGADPRRSAARRSDHLRLQAADRRVMAGLQGSGKTTSSAKLARWFKQQGRNPLLVGRRPPTSRRRRAAAHARPPDRRAGVLGDARAEPVTRSAPARPGRGPAASAVTWSSSTPPAACHRRRADGAGAPDLRGGRSPDYTFLVVDAMTGQDAVTVAETSTQTLALDGVILTKLDGDARGGAALSVKEVVGKPIAFASTGEKLDDFDLFHPDRLAGRILGMGDVLTLIEKAEEAFDEEEAEAAAASCSRASSPSRTSSSRCSRSRRWARSATSSACCPACPRSCGTPTSTTSELEPDRGDHPLDDPRGAARPRDHRRLPAPAHRHRRRAPRREVNRLLKQFDEMQKMMKGLGGTVHQDARARRGRRARRAGASPPKGPPARPQGRHRRAGARPASRCPGLN